MTFEKVVGEESSIVDIMSGCPCNCGCGKCNSQSNPSASADNGGSDLSKENYNGSQHS